MEQLHTRMAGLSERRIDDDDRAIYRYRISTPGLKGDGLDLPNESWDLERFRKHPTVLYNHDIRNMLPIGRAERVWMEDDGLWADVLLDVDDPEAARIAGKIDRGFLSGISVNFRPHNVNRQTKRPERTEMMELSIVSVPEDADVMMARSMMPYYVGNPRLSVQAIWEEIKAADIADLELHMKDSLGDVRALAGRISELSTSDDLDREIQDTIVALRVLCQRNHDDKQPPAEDAVITIDLSQFPALTGTGN